MAINESFEASDGRLSKVTSSFVSESLYDDDVGDLPLPGVMRTLHLKKNYDKTISEENQDSRKKALHATSLERRQS